MDAAAGFTVSDTGSDSTVLWDDYDIATTAAPVRSSRGTFFTRTFEFSLVLVVFNLIALLLNGLVVYIVARYRDVRSTVTLCFANLAITDILLVVFSMSSSLRRTTGIDIQSVTGCVVPVYMHGVSVLCTGLTMAFLAFDRYRLVVTPLAALKQRTKLGLLIIFVSIWAISFAVYAFLLVITVDVGTHCILIYRNLDKGTGDRIYHTFKASVNYFIPVAVTGFFYARIYLSLSRSAGSFPTSTESTSTEGRPQDSGNFMAKRQKKRLRGVRFASLVLFLFVICYLPTTIMSLWRAWDDAFLDSEYYKYHTITGLFSRLCVIGNPFLYSLSGPSFKEKIRQMFVCKRRSPKRQGKGSSANNQSSSHLRSSEIGSTVYTSEP